MKFVDDLKRYWDYTKHSAKAELKSEVASSYLNWLWWILDPLLFMMVYTFIAQVVFSGREKFFPVFVFIGLTMWNYFNKIVIGSVKIVRNNSAIVSKVYVPKFILVIQKMMVNGFKMIISFILMVLMMFFFKVPITWKILYIIPIVLILCVLTFGVSNLMLHFGVFVEDLRNVMTVLLKLTFYMSGIFYSIPKRVPAPYNQWLMKVNPIAFLLNSARGCMLYGEAPSVQLLLFWGLFGLVVSYVSIKILYKYENSYVKVI